MSMPAHHETVEPDHKTTLDLGEVLPQTAEVRDGHLFVGGVDLVDLARKEGTALYVMDEADIRKQLRDYIQWTRFHWKNVDVIYAAKAFMSIAMCKIVEEEGCCIDVSSGGELAFAQAAGFPMDRVFVHGNNKTMQELNEALDAGVGRIVVDSFEELERISQLAVERDMQQGVLIRVTPGVVADTHAYIQTGSEDSKFGFGLHDGLAMKALRRALELPGVDLKGIHMHIGSQVFALDSFAKAVEVIVHFMDSVRTELGYVVEELDVGGGLGAAYAASDTPSTIKAYGKVVVDDIKAHCEAHGLPVPRILTEPGRSIVARAGVTLYTVGTIKDIPGIRTYVAVDGGMTDNIRTELYGAKYEAVVANRADQPRDTVVTIAGKHCESGDIVIYDASLQQVGDGDIICVFTTGAYCQSMSSNYNKQVRPGVMMVRDGRARWVVRRETYDDLLRCEVCED